MAGRLSIRIGRRSIPLLLWGSILLLGLGAGGYFGVWKGLLKDRIFPNNWGVVEPGKIYRSGLIHPSLVKKTLAEHNIRVVVTMVGEDAGDPRQAAEQRAVEELNIQLLRFPMKGNGIPGDADPDAGLRKYAGAVAAIVQALRDGKPVLVQCAAGAQRTGGVVAVYRLLVERKRPAEAYAELRRYGWDPGKNQVLLEYLNGNMPALARMLVEMGVIERAPDPTPVLGP